MVRQAGLAGEWLALLGRGPDPDVIHQVGINEGSSLALDFMLHRNDLQSGEIGDPRWRRRLAASSRHPTESLRRMSPDV